MKAATPRLSRRRVLAAIPALAGIGLFAETLLGRPGQALAADLAAFIFQLSQRAITELTGPGTSERERATHLRALLVQYFDMPVIARYVLGSYWRRASADQQQQFVSVFTDYMSVVYGKRFAEYAGEQIDVKRVRNDPDNYATIFTIVERSNADSNPRIDWTVHLDDDTPKIVDIKVEGLSLADTHRQDFAAAMSSNGGDVGKLIEALKKKSAL